MKARHILYIVLFAMAVAIQWPLWFGKGGISRMVSLERELASIREANDRLRAENDAVAAEIESLESGSGAVEERARMRLGMVQHDEVLFRFVATPVQSGRQPEPVAPGESTGPDHFSPKRSDLYVEGAVPTAKSLDLKPRRGNNETVQ